MLKLILGALVAAIVMMAWGFVFWTTPISSPAFQQMIDAPALTESIRQNVPGSGTYFLPDMFGDKEAMEAAHRSGPIVTLFVHMDGADPADPTIFVKGFVHMFLGALLIAMMLRMAIGALGGFGSRVGFVTLAGIASAFWINIAAPIWFYQPWTFHFMLFVYNVVAWLLAGLVLAWFIKPRALPYP